MVTFNFGESKCVTDYRIYFNYTKNRVIGRLLLWP